MGTERLSGQGDIILTSVSQKKLVARTSGKTPTREVTPEAVCDREAKGLAIRWPYPG